MHCLVAFRSKMPMKAGLTHSLKPNYVEISPQQIKYVIKQWQ